MSFWLIFLPLYFATSLLFLCFPPWKKKRYLNSTLNALSDGTKIICIGHRGGAFQGPQNTIQTFTKNQQNMHMFELDIQETKDHRLVVHHDSSLLRTAGMDLKVSEVEYKDLPRFQKEIRAYGMPHCQGPVKTDQNRIVLLEELFEKYPRKLMNIDLKSPTETAIRQFGDLVKKYKREDVTVWGAIKDSGRRGLMDQIGSVATFYSQMEMVKITLLMLIGLLPFWPIRQGVLQLPLVPATMYESLDTGPTSSNNSQKKKERTVKDRVLTVVVGAGLMLFSWMARLFVPHLRKRGVLTFHWIVNEEQGWAQAIREGCQGIITDRPNALKEYLLSKDLYFEDGTSNQQQITKSVQNQPIKQQ